jgi:hypothetical protein
MAASGLPEVERDEWPSVYRRFLIRENSMLMKNLLILGQAPESFVNAIRIRKSRGLTFFRDAPHPRASSAAKICL